MAPIPVLKDNMVKYPDIEVELIGHDGNAFAIMGAVTSALRKAGISSDEISKYREEAMSGDYEHLLWVTADWVSVC